MVIVHYVHTNLSTWMKYYSSEQYYTTVGVHNKKKQKTWNTIDLPDHLPYMHDSPWSDLTSEVTTLFSRQIWCHVVIRIIKNLKTFKVAINVIKTSIISRILKNSSINLKKLTLCSRCLSTFANEVVDLRQFNKVLTISHIASVTYYET